MIRPSGSQPPAGLSAARGLAALRGYLVVLSYYQLVIFFFNIVLLISETTFFVGSNGMRMIQRSRRFVVEGDGREVLVNSMIRATMLKNNVTN
jgi:hypothetical protein